MDFWWILDQMPVLKAAMPTWLPFVWCVCVRWARVTKRVEIVRKRHFPCAFHRMTSPAIRFIHTISRRIPHSPASTLWNIRFRFGSLWQSLCRSPSSSSSSSFVRLTWRKCGRPCHQKPAEVGEGDHVNPFSRVSMLLFYTQRQFSSVRNATQCHVAVWKTYWKV